MNAKRKWIILGLSSGILVGAALLPGDATTAYGGDLECSNTDCDGPSACEFKQNTKCTIGRFISPTDTVYYCSVVAC